MDRNLWWGVRKAVGSLVALRKESVDRNTQRRDFKALGLPSLSARRAWIEILSRDADGAYLVSLSARRAWIEILTLIIVKRGNTGRSPQGERG